MRIKIVNNKNIILSLLFKMGQSHTQLKQNQDYKLIEQLPVGNIVKHNKTQSLHFLKQYSFTSQEAYQNALNMHSLKLGNKNEHILNFLHFTTKSENSFCSSFHKIILIFQYSQYTLEKQIVNRSKDKTPFTEKEVWSILCSSVLAAVHLIHTEGRMHCGLSSKDIRLSSNGCIKLLSHEMIGIDNSHTQSQGTPKSLAITILQCINLEKVSNQDTNYLYKMTEMLGISKDMKEMLQSMIKNTVSFLQLEEYLIKLVQDDESMASNSNTPVLKSYSPLVSSTYKCPRIIQNEMNNRLEMASQKKDEAAQTMSPDFQDIKSYLYMFEQPGLQTQNPDQTQQQQTFQYPNRCQAQSPNQINSFYLKQRKIQSNIPSVENRTGQLKLNEKEITRKDYEINRVQSSRRKQNNQNIPEISLKSNYQINVNTHSNLNLNSNDSNLFTDPKLFSLIKNDLEEIKMRRSIGELGKYPKSHQIKFGLEQSNHIKAQTDKFSSSSFAISEQFRAGQSKVVTNQIKNQSKHNDGWFKQSQKNNLISSNSLPNLSNDVNKNGLKQIQMIREVSQEYREDDEETKQRRSIAREAALKSYKSEKQFKNQSSNNDQFKVQNMKPVQKSENIMNDDGLGFRKKKQSTATIIQIPKQKQIQSDVPAITSLPPYKPRQNMDYLKTETNYEQKYQQNNEMKPQRSEKSLSSDRHEQYFHQYSRTQSSQSSSRLSSNTNNKNQKEKLIQVSQKYTRGHYEGTKLNGKRHGFGTFFYSEGGKYVGNWKQNKMHGKGILYYPSQKIAYEGEWENDQLSGYGVLFNQQVATLRAPFDYRDWSDVEDYWVKYQGHFSQDNKEGRGKLYLVNGQRFEGEFHEDKVDGEGTLYRGDGSSVRGKWRQNKLIRMF